MNTHTSSAGALEMLQEVQTKIAHTWALLKLDAKEKMQATIEKKIEDPTFWNDRIAAQKTIEEMNALKEEISAWKTLRQDVDDALELYHLAQEQADAETLAEIGVKIPLLQQEYDTLEWYVLLAGAHDEKNALVTVYAGAGGVDAQDWAQMLYRMITRYCEKKDFDVTMLDYTPGQEAGLKSAVIEVRGRHAYGLLKSEHGTHRLVRISPFDAEGMRHTSFANIEVVPEMEDVPDMDIKESDLRIDVFRAGGHGGQSVNTTDSAVRIVHIPTGVTATCQNGKSQHQNKDAALKILTSRLYQRFLEEQQKERDALRGEHSAAQWGNQIRSYVLHPYKMVKDHRTKCESKHPDDVLNGELQPFIDSFLRWKQE